MERLPSGTVTFLFTDIEGSTQLWEQHPETMKSALAKHDAILKESVESNHGYLIKTMGDGILAVFESSSDAANATIDSQLALASTFIAPPTSLPLNVRMGIHTGEAELRDGDYYGSSLNRAARIMSIGHGGQILVSERTLQIAQDFLRPDVSILDLGEHRLKGIAAPEHIFQLCHPDLVADFPALRSLGSFKHNLHRQISTFIGREKELAEVKRLLKDTQLLTLLGPGGTGKTRLMMQAAEEIIEDYPDGVWLVELAPLTDPELIPERVASILHVQEQSDRSILDTLADFLRHKELLLLLDNVEHLVRACAEFAEHLLRRCPKLTLLVTGREALFIDGETTIQIPSLAVPKSSQTPETIAASDAVQLFMERARAVRSDFVLNEQNAAIISEVVRRLDGIPLALELAAARLRMLSIDQINERLNDRFRLLTGGRRTALPRQQTLQALIDWSWQLLNIQECILLRRLSVFSGGWTIEAAQEITGFAPLDAVEVFDLLDQLINKSLVVVRYLEDGETRYTMLESIRQFGQEKLFEAGEGAALRDRHSETFVTLVDQFGNTGLGQTYYDWMNRFSQEADNLRAVGAWIAEDRPLLALHFFGILLQYDPIWLPYREARSWLEPVVEHARLFLDSPPSDLFMKDFIRALQSLGWLLVTHGEMVQGHSLLDENIRLAREFAEFQLLAMTLGMKAQAMGSNVTVVIMAQIEEMIALCRQEAYEIELLVVLFSAGQAHILQGRLDKGKAYLAEVLELMNQIDVPIINTWIYYLQALVGQMEQNPVKAEEYLRLAIEANEKWGLKRMAASARSELAHLYRRQNRMDEARQLYRQTILSWQEQGHLSAVTHQLECMAYLELAQGDSRRAAQLLGVARDTRQRLNALHTEPQEIAEFEQAMDQLEDAIGVEVRDQWMENGARMGLDEMVAIALSETGNPGSLV